MFEGYPDIAVTHQDHCVEDHSNQAYVSLFHSTKAMLYNKHGRMTASLKM